MVFRLFYKIEINVTDFITSDKKIELLKNLGAYIIIIDKNPERIKATRK